MALEKKKTILRIQANKLMDELDDSDINKRNASAIAGVTGKDKQASAQSNMLRALEQR